MNKLKTLAVAGTALLTPVFGAMAEDKIIVEKLSDLPNIFEDRDFTNGPTGVFKIIVKDARDNGEDLPCLYIQFRDGRGMSSGLSCNWAAPKPKALVQQ